MKPVLVQADAIPEFTVPKAEAENRRDDKNYPRTDAGNAELFASLRRDNVRFDHKRGRWLVWNEKQCRWREDNQGEVRRLAKKTARHRKGIATGISDPDDAKREFAWACQGENRNRIDAALELAKSEPPISDDGEGWDADPWLFGAANGIVDLRSGTFHQPTQQDRITKFSPVRFDADATCPRFEKFLEEIFGGDRELIEYVQKAVGYTLTGSVQEQCLFACHGNGSNGKSTLLEIILHLLGDYGIDLPFSVLEAKHFGSAPGEGVNLPGARFAKVVEVREGRKLDEARVKSWTGGDTITVRPLYRNSFSFQPTHKLWLAFNHKPEISDDSTAMWRRVRLIPFTRTFNSHEADKGLLEALKREAPGILNWAIAGCLAWQKDGLTTPKVVEDATREYEADSDPLTPFFEDRCELGDGFKVGKTQLWNACQDWHRANQEKPLSRNAFAERMKNRFAEGRDAKGRFWLGIRLKANDDISDASRPVLQNFSMSPLHEEVYEK